MGDGLKNIVAKFATFQLNSLCLVRPFFSFSLLFLLLLLQYKMQVAGPARHAGF